jgi:hypothetical protein
LTGTFLRVVEARRIKITKRERSATSEGESEGYV